MDPDAALHRAALALNRHDLDEALNALGDLGEWLARGGFPPSADAQQRWVSAVGAWERATGLSWDEVVGGAG